MEDFSSLPLLVQSSSSLITFEGLIIIKKVKLIRDNFFFFYFHPEIFRNDAFLLHMHYIEETLCRTIFKNIPLWVTKVYSTEGQGYY